MRGCVGHVSFCCGSSTLEAIMLGMWRDFFSHRHSIHGIGCKMCACFLYAKNATGGA
jgi:hypothetical protein